MRNDSVSVLLHRQVIPPEQSELIQERQRTGADTDDGGNDDQSFHNVFHDNDLLRSMDASIIPYLAGKCQRFPVFLRFAQSKAAMFVQIDGNLCTIT